MSTRPTTEITEAIREQLVAYLDGELAPDEAREVEQRLANQEAYQRELKALEQSWDALDELPHVTVGEGFAKSTIEMTTLEAEREVSQLTQMMPTRKRRARWALAGFAAAALMGGFLLSRAAWTTPDERLVQDLPVVWRVDALVQLPSVGFLDRLIEEQPRLVSNCCNHDTRDDAAAWAAISAASPQARRAQITALDPPAQQRLSAADRRFRAMSPTRRATLRQRYDALQSQDDQTARLHQAALAYNEWVSQQSPTVQVELRQLASEEERLQRIAELRQREEQRSRRTLNAQEASRLRVAVREAAATPAASRLPDALREQTEWLRQAMRSEKQKEKLGRAGRWALRWGERADDLMRTHPAMPLSFLSQVAHSRDHRGRWLRRMLGPRSEQLAEQAKEDWAEIEPTLLATLDDSTREDLQDDSAERRAMRLRRWILETAADALEPGGLEDFFASGALTDQQRNELLALPRSEMNEQLRRYYFEQELGAVDPEAVQELTPILRAMQQDSGPRGDT